MGKSKDLFDKNKKVRHSSDSTMAEILGKFEKPANSSRLLTPIDEDSTMQEILGNFEKPGKSDVNETPIDEDATM